MINSIEEKKIIFATFFVGLITHLFIITNPILNPDGFYYTNSLGGGLVLGRWVVDLLNKLLDLFGYTIVNPMLNIVVSLIFLSISAIFLIRILDINNIFIKYIISISLVVSPSIVQIFFYSFTSHIYCLSIFLTILSIYFLTKHNNLFLYSILNLVAIGIYQAYIPFFLTLVCLALIKKIINCSIIETVVFTLRAVFGFLLSVSMSLMINYILNNLFNNSNYIYKIHGMTNEIIPELTVESIISSISISYENIFKIFNYENFFAHNTTSLVKIVYLCLIIITIIFLLLIIYKNFLKDNVLSIINNLKQKLNFYNQIDFNAFIKLLFFLIVVIFLPIAINFFVVMTNDNVNNIDDRMAYSFVFFVILPLYLIDLNEFKIFLKKNLMNICIVLSLIILYHNIWIAYGSYYNQYNVLNASKSFAIELATRIQMVDGFNKDCYILFLGNPIQNSKDKEVDSIYYSDVNYDIFSNQDFKYDNILCDDYIFDIVFKKFSSLNIKKIDDKYLEQNLKYSKFVKDMSIYPNENSIKIFNNVIIVKFNEIYG